MARPREFNEAEVMDKATDLFWAKGYRRTSPADLAAATGLSKSSLYNAFGNKQALFLRALDRYTAQQHGFLAVGLSERSLRQGLEWLFDQVVAGSAPPEQGGMGRSCLVCTTAIDAEPVDEAIQAQLRRSREAICSVFRARFSRAQRDGELPADKDPVALADFLFGTNNGLIVLARAGATAEEMRAVARLATDAILD